MGTSKKEGIFLFAHLKCLPTEMLVPCDQIGIQFYIVLSEVALYITCLPDYTSFLSNAKQCLCRHGKHSSQFPLVYKAIICVHFDSFIFCPLFFKKRKFHCVFRDAHIVNK